MQLSFSRLWLLIYKQWAENYRLYLLALLATAGTIAGILFFSSGEDPGIGLQEDTQRGIFWGGLFIGGSILTSTLMGGYSNKLQVTQVLMLPASVLEKLLASAIYSFVFFPIVYLVIIYPLVQLGHYFDSEVNGNLSGLFNLWSKDSIEVLLSYVAVQSFILTCAVIFRKYIVVTTIVLLCGGMYGIYFTNSLIAQAMFSNIEQPRNPPEDVKRVTKSQPGTAFSYYQAFPYSEVSFSLFKYNYWRVKLPEQTANRFGMMKWLLVPGLWLVAWLRLRERQLK